MNRDLLGVGIYSIPEAVRLTGVPGESIRRWLWGTRGSLPLWHSQIPAIDHSKALGFRDLVEVKFVAHFRDHGLSMQSIRRIIGIATDLLEQSYPLSSIRFKTLGKRVFAEVLEGEERKLVFDLATGQLLLSFMWDQLYEALEYSKFDELLRWWPLGKHHRVVIDPRRSFGRPITLEGVPTSVLAAALRAEKSADKVARWFEVEPASVQDADEFERLQRAA